MTHSYQYELMVILDPEIDERQVAPKLDGFLKVITADGGSIDNVDVWGQRRLAYEIQKKNEGIYAVVNFTATSEATQELDRQLKLNEQIMRTKVLPFNRPGAPGVLDAVIASQSSNTSVNAVLVTLQPGHSADEVAQSIERWKRLTAYTRADMQEILVGKLISTSARQIGMFLAILAVVSAAIVAFIIYTLTMDKIREIAVLKLIGTRNRTIAAMILQQALMLGVLGFVVGKISATFAAPIFPKYVLLVPADSIAGFAAVLAICVLASVVAIRVALKVDPADAIG